MPHRFLRTALLGLIAAASMTAPAEARRDGRWSITLYSEANFTGEALRITGDVDNLKHTSGWNDRAKSLIVEAGSWDVCENKGHDNCKRVGPGTRIADLGQIGLYARISSVYWLEEGRSYKERSDRVRDAHEERLREHERDYYERGGQGADGWWPGQPQQPPRGGWDRPAYGEPTWGRPGQGRSRLSPCQEAVRDGMRDQFNDRWLEPEFRGGPDRGVAIVGDRGRRFEFECRGGQVYIW